MEEIPDLTKGNLEDEKVILIYEDKLMQLAAQMDQCERFIQIIKEKPIFEMGDRIEADIHEYLVVAVKLNAFGELVYNLSIKGGGTIEQSVGKVDRLCRKIN